VALLQKITCNSRHRRGLRHSVPLALPQAVYWAVYPCAICVSACLCDIHRSLLWVSSHGYRFLGLSYLRALGVSVCLCDIHARILFHTGAQPTPTQTHTNRFHAIQLRGALSSDADRVTKLPTKLPQRATTYRALLRKMTCNLRHPMGLCHPVDSVKLIYCASLY